VFDRAFFEVFLLNFPLLGLLLCLYSLFSFDIPAFETKDGAGLFKAVTVLVAWYNELPLAAEIALFG
jgi:hypothetical protein